MNFLAQILANISVVGLNWLYEKIAFLLSRALEKQKIFKEIEEKNKAIREQTEAAQTKEEREDAAKNTTDNF